MLFILFSLSVQLRKFCMPMINGHIACRLQHVAFLSHVSTVMCDIDIAILSIRPSVRPSVRNVLVSDENGLTYCHSFFTIRQPNHSSFTGIKHFHKIPTGSVALCRCAKYRWGIKISRFLTSKLLYLTNDTRQCHSYYGRRIGNCTQAFEWHQFQ